MSVILFHAGVPLFRGGWLGVDLFVVLSGWLITGILIDEIRARGTIAYGAFLARRVRRLVPGVALLLSGVGLLALVGQLALRSGSVIAAATWTSNWYQLASHHGYWTQAQGASPLDHLWSLAVEEQFYIVWPIVIGLVIWCARPRHRVQAVRVAAVGGAAISMVLAFWATHAGWRLDRIYLGSDTRSGGFLLGAAVAGLRLLPHSRASRALAVAGPLCAAGLAVAVTTFRSSPTMFGGAVQAADLACVVVVLWVAGMRRGPLSTGPLVTIGRLSYGLYLWHWPLMLIAGKHIGDAWARALVVTAVSSLAAAASFRFVEQPLRNRPWLERSRVVPRLPRVAVIAPVLALLMAPAVLAAEPGNGPIVTVRFDDATIAAAREAGQSTPDPSTPRDRPASVGSIDPDPQTPRPECRTIIHLGDSNLGMARPLFEVAYRATGVQAFIDPANGRGAYRSHDSEAGGAIDAIDSYRALTTGQRCWVIELGAQDAADAASGADDPSRSIDAILAALQGEPTIWVAPALHGTPPFTHAAATSYTSALRTTTAGLDNVAVIDWPAIADPRAADFQPDGIHYNAELYTTLVQTVLDEVRTSWTLVPMNGSAAALMGGP